MTTQPTDPATEAANKFQDMLSIEMSSRAKAELIATIRAAYAPLVAEAEISLSYMQEHCQDDKIIWIGLEAKLATYRTATEAPR